jgi:UDP-GlcNAc:undecaprenyl-phosphate/decaprenyl-phosphate GlcNAc-1-phosphate transferase
MSELLGSILIPFVAAIATAGLVPLVRAAGLSGGHAPSPSPDRWSTRPTSNLGGLAIVGGFTIAAAMHVAFNDIEVITGRIDPRAVVPLTPQLGLIMAAAAAAILGFVDDLVQLKPATKLAGQIAASSILVLTGVGVWLTGNYFIDVPISLFWFVGITNALNLLDNMDGVAAGIGLIAAAFMGVGFLLVGDVGLAVLAFAFSGALAGFLTHNYPPARIFMGDSGSLFIGIFLAGLALAPAPGLTRGLFAVVALPLVALAVPILDTTFVTITRLLEGRAVSQGGRDHTSHGLVSLGLSEERALWILWSLAIAGGFLGLLVRTSSRTFAYVLGGVLIVSLGLLAAYLLSDRMLRGTQEETGGRTSTLSRLLQMHRQFPVLTVALDVVLMSLAYFGAYLIRWDAPQLAAELAYFQRSVVIVVALKVVAFTAANAYAPQWRHFSMSDGIAVLRANLVGTLLMAAVLLLVSRSGLSRGVLIIDFFVCSVMTLGGRMSFRLIEGAKQRWAIDARSVAVVGGLDEAEIVVKSLPAITGQNLRVVAVVDPHEGSLRAGRFHGYPVYGGESGLRTAIAECDFSAVVIVDGESASGAQALVESYLMRGSGLDTFSLSVTIRTGLPQTDTNPEDGPDGER